VHFLPRRGRSFGELDRPCRERNRHIAGDAWETAISHLGKVHRAFGTLFFNDAQSSILLGVKKFLAASKLVVRPLLQVEMALC